MTSRNNGLDTLRSVAILLVLAYHYMVFVSREPTFGWVSTLGWVGVDLFFVLSGYLISNQVFSGWVKGRELSLKNFYARRFLRTLPAFYVVLALYFLFPTVMGGREPPPLWRFLTFTQNIGLKGGTAFSHAWSLCIEEQFYVLFAAVVLIAAHLGRSIRLAWIFLAALIATGCLARSVLWAKYGLEAFGEVNYYPTYIYYSSLCRADEFLPGIAVAMLKNFHPVLWNRLMQWGQSLLLGGIAATAALFYLLLNHYYVEGFGYFYFMTAFGYSLIAIAFAILVMAALSPDCMLYRWRVPGAASLATWSYSIYLSHKPLSIITHRILQGPGIAGASLVVAVAAVSLIGGWLLYRLVELPFLNIRDRSFPTSFTQPQRAPLVSINS